MFGPIVTGSVGWREDGVLSNDEEAAEWDDFVHVMMEEVKNENENEGGEEERNLIGGWKAVEEVAADSFPDLPVEAIKNFVEMDQMRERGSSISLVTSSAKNSLYFA